MTALAPDLREMLAAVEIRDEERFRVLGETVYRIAGQTLAETLAGRLYTRLYLRGEAGEPASGPPVSDLAAGRKRLSWQPGWRVRQAPEGRPVIAEREGVCYRVPVDRVRGSGSLQPGDVIDVCVPGEQQFLLSGFHLILGGADLPTRGGSFLLRVYWNLQSKTATVWLRSLIAALDRLQLPFRAKVLAVQEAYTRTDAGVLYLPAGCWPRAVGAIREVYGELASELCPEVPRLTLRLAPGLGLAEGPGDGQSFGQHRCALIAEALVRAFAEGRPAAPAVAAAFAETGLDPRQPYRASASRAAYPFPGGFLSPAPVERPEGRARVRREATSFTALALSLGLDLCREARWHEGRCNWFGAAPAGRRQTHWRTLGVDLYGGTSGMCLFLAATYACTGERALRETVLGAARQILHRLGGEPSDLPPSLSFLEGQLGAAWTLHRAAAWIGELDLAAAAQGQLSRLLSIPMGEHRLDVLSGIAGAIFVLLDLHRATGDGRLLASAEALGDEICGAAERTGETWAWPTMRASGIGEETTPPLTGLSHGNAGIGLALLSLFQATGREPFSIAARGAFAYEDGLFDAGRGNWPDLRRAAPVAGKEPPPPAFMVAWCHGAPGIALSRLRALEIDPGRAASYAPAARAGLATTLDTLRVRLRLGDADTSLCHGLAGLIEVAAEAARIFGEPTLRHAAHGALRSLAVRHAENRSWPSGLASRVRTPGLFLGEAGIGYTLLRLDHPGRLPSVLAL